MSGPVLVKLHRPGRWKGVEVVVNMSSVLFINPSSAGGSLIHMNIPDGVLEVLEDPHQIRHAAKEVMGGG